MLEIGPKLIQVDHESDSDTFFSIPTTETECKGKYKRESFYVPDEASQESESSLTDVQDNSREQLNRFLQARDISPVPRNEAQSRSKRRYV